MKVEIHHSPVHPSLGVRSFTQCFLTIPDWIVVVLASRQQQAQPLEEAFKKSLDTDKARKTSYASIEHLDIELSLLSFVCKLHKHLISLEFYSAGLFFERGDSVFSSEQRYEVRLQSSMQIDSTRSLHLNETLFLYATVN